MLVPGTKLKPAGSTKLTVCALTELVFGLEVLSAPRCRIDRKLVD